jgi:hypothetical protein
MLLGTPATMAVANMGSALTAVSTTYALSGAVVSSVTGGALSALL